MEPKIRFKGFSGVWKETTISETGKCISGIGFPEQEQGGRTGIPFYKVSDMNNVGNEKVMTVSNNYVSLEQVKKNGWKVITDVPAIYFAKVGAAVLLNRKRLVLTPCLCDNNTMLFSFDKVKWDSFFCYSYFETLDLSSLVQVGSLPSYNNNIVGKINILQPIPKEQKAIGLYFKYLDDLIQSTIKKIESLKQVKAASLQSMFPQGGEKIPSVRFNKFNSEWRICKLGAILTERHEVSTITEELPQLSFTIADGVIRPEDRKTNQRDFLIKDKDNKRYLITRVGDIIYNPANVVFGAIHRNSLIDGVVSPIYRIFYTNQDSRFIECVVRRPSFISQLAMRTEGTVTKLKTLKPEAFLDMEVCIPTDQYEQIAIGEYFRNLDRQINLLTQRLDKIKQIKSACLDNMFV